MKTEDERRWLLLDGMPDLGTRKVASVDHYDHITQFYIASKLGSHRFRKAVGTRGNRYTETIKGPKEFSAGPEWEVETDQWVYEMKLHDSIGTVEKTRTTTVVDGQVYEVDDFMGRCSGLVIVELEFRPPEGTKPEVVKLLRKQYHKIKLPAVFGRNLEITGDSSYSNLSLALFGIPEITYDH